MGKEVTGIVIAMLVACLLGGGLGKMATLELAKSKLREQLVVATCDHKGGTYLQTEGKCIGAKVIQ